MGKLDSLPACTVVPKIIYNYFQLQLTCRESDESNNFTSPAKTDISIQVWPAQIIWSKTI